MNAQTLRWIRAVSLLIALHGFPTAAAGAPGGESGLPQKTVQKLDQSVFEVVTPKLENPEIAYEKPLPLENLPYKERTDRFQSIGTAFAIEGGTFVSAAHVFSPELSPFERAFFIRDAQGRVFPIQRVVRYSNHRDLIEFSVGPSAAAPVIAGAPAAPAPLAAPHTIPLAVRDQAAVGETVYAVGNALGEGLSVRGGQLASFTPEENKGEWKFIRFSAPASPGNSGGPLLDREGKVIGVILRRSESENLNYAIPIQEVQTLSKKFAQFYERDARSLIDGKTLVKAWDFMAPLPSTLTALSQSARTSLKTHLISLTTQLYQKESAAVFPLAPELTEYLRSPAFTVIPTHVNRESNGKWSATKSQIRRVDVGTDQTLWFDLEKVDNLVVVRSDLQRPKGEALKDFINQPEHWIRAFAKGLGSHRTVGTESIPITTYGKPQHFYRWEDSIGRPWYSALWRVTYGDTIISSHCLPNPEGVACLTTIGPSMLEAIGMSEQFRLQANRVHVSYRGKVKDWEEFLALGPQYIPRLFSGSKIKLHGLQAAQAAPPAASATPPSPSATPAPAASEPTLASAAQPAPSAPPALEVSLPGFGAVYRPIGADADSLLLVRVGLHPVITAQQGPRLWVHGFEFSPRPEKPGWQSVRLTFEPTPQDGEDARKTWNLLAQGLAPFDGQVALQDGNQVRVKAQAPVSRGPASDAYGYQGVGYRLLISCGADSTTPPQAVMASCMGFEQGLRH